MIFLFVIDFVSLLLPAVCIASARLIIDLSNKAKKTKFRRTLPFVVISILGAFGLVSTTTLITLDVNSSYFDVYTSIVQYLVDYRNQLHQSKDKDFVAINEGEVTMYGRHWTRSYFWIPKYAFDINIDFKRIDRANDIPIPALNDKILLIVDNRVRNSLAYPEFHSSIQKYYYYYSITPLITYTDRSIKYDTSKYPYTSMSENRDVDWVQIRGFNLKKPSSYN